MTARQYWTLNYPGSRLGDKTFLTGIRYADCKYYITGFYESMDAPSTSFLYIGSIDGSGTWHRLNYPETDASTSLYGPDICICCGHVTLVGNYGTEGVIYRGPPDGTGSWSLISPPGAVATIWHSVYNGVIVGNYKLTPEGPSRACIYHPMEGFIEIPHPDPITAYGIWSHHTSKFTICGGVMHRGYCVEYDICTRKFSKWRYYTYPGAQEPHFDGISPSGSRAETWSVTGVSNMGAFQANLKGESAQWSTIAFPGAETTTGNSVFKKVVIGVYTRSADSSVNGFISF